MNKPKMAITDLHGCGQVLDPGIEHELDALNTAWGNVKEGPRKTLVSAWHNIDHALSYESPRTTDNYRWFLGLTFKIERGEVIICFPHYTDGSPDRSIAIYMRGDFSLGSLQELLQNLIAELDKKQAVAN